VQEFFGKTIAVLSNSSEVEGFTRADLENTIALVRDFQADFRDLSDTLSQVTIDKASKERERGQLDIELAKSSSALETELRLKQLELSSASTRAKNEARAAQLLAQRLATTAGGVVPIFASRSGILASVEKNVGAYVAVSDTIGHISTKSPERRIRFTVPPSWKEIKRGDTLTTSWRSEYAPSTATVTGVSPMIAENGGYQAEALLARDAAYPLGASVTLIPERSKKGAFIHRKAVVFEDTKPYVWTLGDKEELIKTTVTAGRQLGEYVEITSELPRGTEYLVIFDTDMKLEAGKLITEYITTPAPEEHAGEEEEGDGHNHEE
jgi:multidrug efflux pump subunit AcrA (membrane-fusion protein)